MEIICLEHIAHKFGVNEVLKDINLTVCAGDFIVPLGENGTGKSTLLHIIAGMLSPIKGAISYKGEKLDLNCEKVRDQFRKEKIGMVSQDFSLLYDMKVANNIALSLQAKKIPKSMIKKRVKEIMNEIHILDLADRYPDTLSGGQCQKVAIARALVKKPEILLADEPTASLDSYNKEDILSIFLELANKGIAVIVATHEEKIVQMASQVYMIRDGILHMK